MATRISKRIPSSFPLDGTVIQITIARMTKEQLVDLTTEHERIYAVKPAPENGPPPALTREDRLARLNHAVSLITQFVSVPEGQLVDDDGQPILSGQQFVEALGGREDVLMGVSSLVLAENRVSDHQKKVWKSALGSALGWPEWNPPPSGDAPAPTAGSAAPPDSIANGAVTSPSTPSAGPSSGAGDPITSASAPSGS